MLILYKNLEFYVKYKYNKGDYLKVGEKYEVLFYYKPHGGKWQRC